MPELDPALLDEMRVRERWIVRERILVGLGLIGLGALAMVWGFLLAVAVGGLDGVSVLLATWLVAAWCLRNGATMVDHLARVRLPQWGSRSA